MSNLLVTGAAGFIGANFVHHWCARHPGDRVVALDALTYAGNLASLAPLVGRANMRFVPADIADEAEVLGVLRAERIDTLVHFAAESHVDRSITGPDAFVMTNVLGTHALLKMARIAAAEGTLTRFHHVSTDEVYGTLGPRDPAFTENTAYAPNSPYAASKAGSDHLVRAYHHTFGLPVTTSNCSNNYGPYQFPEKLIPLMLVNALTGRPLPIYGDGRNVRDWLYVGDHCAGIELVLRRGRLGETYNIGGNNERANIDVVTVLCELVDEAFARDADLARRFPDAPAARDTPSRSLITYVEDRLGHDRRYAVNADKARAELGYEPSETFETGLARTVDWYLANEAWWRDVLSGAYRESGTRPRRG